MEPENSSSVTQNLTDGAHLIHIFIMRSVLILPTLSISLTYLAALLTDTKESSPLARWGSQPTTPSHWM
jgi:hypothetical protein